MHLRLNNPNYCLLKMNKIIVFSLFLFLGINTYGQYDSTLVHLPKLKLRPFTAAAEAASSNIIINRVDAWVRDLDWAKVTPQHWYDNLHTGFDTDGDAFSTNFFSHPYHGSMFFNSARSNGASLWGSIPYVLAGSWTWEYFCETYPPSEIDWNTTTLGGIYLGEITHRLTTHLLQNDKARSYRVLRNIGASIINPMAQINSLMYSDTRQGFRSSDLFHFPIRSQFSMGISYILTPEPDFVSSSYMHMNYSFIYGDLFDGSDNYRPFDFFIIRSWLDINSLKDFEKNYVNLTSHSPLWRYNNSEKNLFTVSSHYAFIHNPIFKIGSFSLTADYHFNAEHENYSLMSGVKFGPILFGSANSEVVEVIEKFEEDDGEFLRDYVYGRGLMVELEMLAVTKRYGRLITSFNYWLIFTQRDTPGTERNAIYKLEYYLPIWNNWGLGVEFFHYQRAAHYNDHPVYQNIRKSYSEIKILSSVTF